MKNEKLKRAPGKEMKNEKWKMKNEEGFRDVIAIEAKKGPETGNPSLFFILNFSFFIYSNAYFSLYTTAWNKDRANL